MYGQTVRAEVRRPFWYEYRQTGRRDLELGITYLLVHGFPALPNREHPGFRAHGVDLRACCVGAKARQELVPNVPLHGH